MLSRISSYLDALHRYPASIIKDNLPCRARMHIQCILLLSIIPCPPPILFSGRVKSPLQFPPLGECKVKNEE